LKCMDTQTAYKQVLYGGPDKADMLADGLAFSEYTLKRTPAHSYHHRVARWMAQTRRAPKLELECLYCHRVFEGRKGRKFCSIQCRQRDYQGTPLPVEPQHVFGECECVDCMKVYDLFMEMRTELLTEEFGDKPFTRSLTDDEKAYILDFAKHQVNNQ
jgi:hypothetical protein